MRIHCRSVAAPLAALVLATAAAAQTRVGPRETQEEDVSGREAWFWSQRAFPGTEPPYAKMSLLQQSLPGYLRRLSASAVVAPLGGSWRPLGPEAIWVYQVESGRIAGILPPLTPGGPMYVGTASGGVWRSTNRGISWTPLTDSQCSLTTGALARDPVTPSIIYAATGEGNQGTAGCGVLRSADGGDSWTVSARGLQSSNGAAGPFTTLVVDPANAGTNTSVLLGSTNFTNAGIVRSTNAGATWTPVLNTGPATSITAHPTHAGVYYAGNRVTTPATSRGVYRTGDGGITWSQLPAFPSVDANAVGRVEVAMSSTDPTNVWALVGDRGTGGFLGLFRFSETTQTWTQLAASGVTASLFGAQQAYDLVLLVDPTDSRRIFIAGVNAFMSSDGGATFQRMGADVHSDWHVLVLDPSDPRTIWAGTDGGVYLSTDGGASWVSRSAGLSVTQFYPGVSVHPQGTRIAGGAQDNGTHVFTGTSYWDAFSGGDGGYTAINYRDPTIQWGETQWSGTTTGNIYRRDAFGLARRNSGLTLSDRASFIPPLIMDPVNPSKLYFGTYRLYRTTNDGLAWAPISGDLTTGSGAITSIAISPVDTNTIIVGTNDGVVRYSRDGGATFVQATGLPLRSVTRVVAHPTSPLRALVTVSGYGSAHVFETTDGFATPVTSVTGNLIDAPTNVAIYLPTRDVMLVGTDVGVFQSADGGVTWAAGPTGLPNVIVQDLVYQPATGSLIAGTYGRGMFAYDLGTSTASLRGDANGDGKIDAADALLIQQALVGVAPATTTIYPRGDANCNGRIDSADLVLILRAAVGLPTSNACVGTTR